MTPFFNKKNYKILLDSVRITKHAENIVKN